MDVLLFVHRVILAIYCGNKEPLRIGAARIRRAVAPVRGIDPITVGIGSAVISMECGITSRFIGSGGIRVCVAPVVIQISGNRVRIDHRFGGFRFGSSDLRVNVVILGIDLAAGAEARRPVFHIEDGIFGNLNPIVSNQLIAIQRVRGRGYCFQNTVTVLGLAFDEAFVHIRLSFLPTGHLRIFYIIEVTAKTAGIFRSAGCLAIAVDGLTVVAVASGGEHLSLDIAAGSADPGSGAVGHTGRLRHRPLAVGMSAGDRFGIHIAAGRTGMDHRAGLGAAGLHQGGIGIAVGTGGLADAGGNSHKVFLHQIHRSGVALQ